MRRLTWATKSRRLLIGEDGSPVSGKVDVTSYVSNQTTTGTAAGMQLFTGMTSW